MRSDGRIMLTKVMPDGKRRSFYGSSDSEVEAKYAAALSEAQKPAQARTFEEVANDWWQRKEPTLSPNSLTSYRAKLKELKSEFGDKAINEISVQEIYQWLDRKALQGYAQRGINDRRSVAKCIFDHAITTGEISANPCRQVPTVKGKPKQKRKPASEADVALLEEIKTESLIATMYYFMEYTGCRVGEASVIQQKDIDREHGKATVCKDLAFREQTPIVKDRTKSEAGMREVDLYDNVLEILPEYDDPETYVFFPAGLPTRYQWLKVLRTFESDHGLTSTPHQFRHTYAGIMHSAEIDVKDTQARMGHANVAMTQDTYTEIERQYNAKTRAKANKYIMEERLGVKEEKRCPACGSTYMQADDGHVFAFCPDCGAKLPE